MEEGAAPNRMNQSAQSEPLPDASRLLQPGAKSGKDKSQNPRVSSKFSERWQSRTTRNRRLPASPTYSPSRGGSFVRRLMEAAGFRPRSGRGQIRYSQNRSIAQNADRQEDTALEAAGVGLPQSSNSRMISRTRWAQSARNDRKPRCRYKTGTGDPPTSEGLHARY